MSIVAVYMTAPNREEAERIGRILVESRLVACVNIIDQVTSLYWWEGKIQRESEVVAIAKTRLDLVPMCLERIKSLHPYEVPGLTVLPVINADPDYKAWVENETIAGR